MATIKKFEDLIAWQKARLLCKLIYDITKQNDFQKDFRFRDQIRSSSGSVMDNLAEGFERGGKHEFVHFISISKGSIAECKSQLYRASDYQYISKEKTSELINLCEEIAKTLNGLMVYLNKSDTKGYKYKDRVDESHSVYLQKDDDFS